ncbi:MAG: carboxypeptidase regulatory-like domain-containing protein [Planctomycetota bacterium]
MRAIHLALAAVLLAVLTAALWLWLEIPAGVAHAGGGSSTSQQGTSGDSRIDPQLPGDGSRSVPSISRTPLASPEPEPVVPPRAWRSGDAPKLRGRIVDPQGEGIPGATVLAASGEFWIQIPLDVEPEGLPRDWFEVEQTITDAEGRFSFESLEPGTLRIAARAPWFACAREDRLTLPDRPEHELADIVLERGVVLSGRVVDRERKGVAGAALLQPLECGRDEGGNEVSFPSRGVLLATTDSDGAFTIDELAAGPWSLIVDAPGFSVSEESGRTRTPGDRVGDLLFRVDRGFEILGRVRAEEGELPAGLRVSARPSPEEEEGQEEGEDGELPSPASSRVRHAICADDGSFTVRGLQGATRYALSLWLPDEKGTGWKLARGTATAHGYAGQRGVEIVYKPGAALVFRVTDARSGLPLTEFTVWAGVGNARVLQDDEGETVRNFPEGSVRYGGLRPKRGGKPVHLRVAASGYADHERKNVALDPGQTLDLGTIALAPERVVHATVVDDRTGEPVEGARVVLGQKTAEELRNMLGNDPESDLHGLSAARYGRTDEHGRARLTSWPGKPAIALADAKGYLVSEPVSSFLPEGEDPRIELRLRRGGTVAATVRDRFGNPVEDVAVERKDPSQRNHDGEHRSRRTDPLGVARFEALEPGVYAFRIRGPVTASQHAWRGPDRESDNQGWVEVVAVDGGTAALDFVVESRGGLFGAVREGGRPLAGARLRLVDPEQAGKNEQNFWGGGHDPLAALTDSEGSYRFDQVECGAYTLEVVHGTRKMVARLAVEIATPPRAFDVDLDVAVIEGRVVGEDGRGLEGIEVQCLNADGMNESQGSWRVLLTEDEEGDADVDYRQEVPPAEKTDANGNYSLRGVRSGEPVQVQASGDRVMPETKTAIKLGPGEIRRHVDFALADAGAIEVVMTGNPSSGRSGHFRVQASAMLEDGQAGASSWGHVGTWNRTSRLGSLAPGRYKVQVHRSGRQRGQPILDVEVEVVVRETVRLAFQAP